jgi:uncharacterized protein involved in exopolysaccharide biosynthesis
MAAEIRPDGSPALSSAPPPVVTAPNESDLFDYALIKDYISYVLGSVSRHRWFCGFVVTAIFAATATLLWALPRTYHVETRLLALRNQTINLSVNPGANRPWDADQPTRAAVDTIMRHDNLVAIVKQTNLVTKWPKSRAPLMKLKDRVFEALRRGRPIPEEDQIAAMVGTLETHLDVIVGEGTITIGLDWPDAAMAYELINAAQRNFLEARRLAEVSPLSDAIGILEQRAIGLREEIVADVERVEAARDAAAKRHPLAVPKAPRPAVSPVQLLARQQADRQREEMRTALDAKKRAIADLEQTRTRNLEELQTQLKDARKIYADEHPIVLGLQHDIEVLQGTPESPELRKLREEKETLETEALRRGAISPAEVAEGETGVSRRLPTSAEQLARATTAEIEDAPIEQAKEDLRFAMSKYSALLDRIDTAQMELQGVNAAFKYRYSTVTPAELPRAPIKPKVPMILLASIIGGMAVAVLLSALRDVRRGLVFERWQVGRQLGVPILGEVHQ